MKYHQLAQIIKIKQEFHNSTVAQDLEDYHSTGVSTRDKQMDPKVSETSEEFVIPSPKKNEQEKDYISRCMKAIGSEYKTPAQGVAVCYSQWKKKDKK